jgi:hypothetical protein
LVLCVQDELFLGISMATSQWKRPLGSHLERGQDWQRMLRFCMIGLTAQLAGIMEDAF